MKITRYTNVTTCNVLMLQQVVHIVTTTVLRFVMNISINLEGEASKRKILHKQMQKLTFNVPVPRVWGTGNRQCCPSSSWQCCQVSGTNIWVVLHRTSNCTKNSEYGNTTTCGFVSQTHASSLAPSPVQNMEQECSGSQGHVQGH
jgi:hypothetical protein